MRTFITIVFLMIFGENFAQETNIFPVPNFKNTIAMLNSNENVLIDLEKVKPQYDYKTKALGYGGLDHIYKIPKEVSTVKLKNSIEKKFIVKLADSEIDPVELISFIKLTPKSKFRNLKISNTSVLGVKNNDKQYLNFNTKRISEDCACYLVEIEDYLEIGEYAFSISSGGDASKVDTYTWFAFSIE